MAKAVGTVTGTDMGMGMVGEVTEEKGNTKAVIPGANVVRTVPAVRGVNGLVVTANTSTILVHMGVGMTITTTSGRTGRGVSAPRGCRQWLQAALVEIDPKDPIANEGNMPIQM